MVLVLGRLPRGEKVKKPTWEHVDVKTYVRENCRVYSNGGYDGLPWEWTLALDGPQGPYVERGRARTLTKAKAVCLARRAELCVST